MQNRTCRACEGTGRRGYYLVPLSDGSRARVPVEWGCLACAGTGRVSERIPTSDAIADAETLIRLAADLVPYSGSSLGNEEWQTHNIGESARHAYSALQWGLATYIPGKSEGAKTRKRSERVRTYSLLAARAAFRAVPGLRS